MVRMPEILVQTGHGLMQWLLPSRCLVCGEACEAAGSERPATLCHACFHQMLPSDDPECRNCGAVLGPWADPAGKCPHCRGRRFRFRTVTCLGMYDGPLRDLLLAGKWSGSCTNVRTLSRVFVSCRSARLSALEFDRIIPIPQIWHRRLARSFNAAELVATEVGRQLRRPVDVHVLRRGRRTRLQKRALLSERAAIQRNSFRIRDGHVIRGERLLLTDDVLTTGATCNEAVRMLLQAGAAECHVAVLGRVTVGRG